MMRFLIPALVLAFLGGCLYTGCEKIIESVAYPSMPAPGGG